MLLWRETDSGDLTTVIELSRVDFWYELSSGKGSERSILAFFHLSQIVFQGKIAYQICKHPFSKITCRVLEEVRDLGCIWFFARVPIQ